VFEYQSFLTRDEVSILSRKFVQDLFPGQELYSQSKEVRSHGDGLVKINCPIMLTVDVCNIVLTHSFYYYDTDKSPVFLMGFDLITAAAMTIDAESR